MRLEASRGALTALHARLDGRARDAYWAAFADFLRGELTKADFDRQALAALGPHVALHNDVVLALLQDVQERTPPGAMDVDLPTDLRIFGAAAPPRASNGGGASSSAASSALAV